MTHLLVTNDFPPKVGGIQSYLFELWRRIPPERFAVLTRSQPGDAEFDAALPFRVERVPARMLLPTAATVRTIDRVAEDVGASLAVLDPVLPLGGLGARLRVPYAVVLHGAEVTVPARLPLVSSALRRVIHGAALVIAAGGYPAREARRLVGRSMPEMVVVPPGVDTARFRPPVAAERDFARWRFGLREHELVAVSVSRLVPRKGMDVLIEASAQLASEFPELRVVIGGTGRDRRRLERLAHRLAAPVSFMGRVTDEDLPALLGAADLEVMLCRNRWLGLEQEGFGIVFLEAASCGVPQVAGLSGGAAEAVLDGRTGLVVDRPGDRVVASEAIKTLLSSPELRAGLGAEGRARSVAEFDYEGLAARLAGAIARAEG